MARQRGKLTWKHKGVTYHEPFTILGKSLMVKRVAWTPVVFDAETDPCFVRTKKITLVEKGEKLNIL